MHCPKTYELLVKRYVVAYIDQSMTFAGSVRNRKPALATANDGNRAIFAANAALVSFDKKRPVRLQESSVLRSCYFRYLP